VFLDVPRGVDRYDEAQLQGRLWTPKELRASGNLKLWCDASDIATIITTSGLVSQWSDKSGFNNHLIQGTAVNRMGYDSSYLYGKPGLTEPDQTDALDCAGISMAPPYFVLCAFSTKSVQGSYARFVNIGVGGTGADVIGFFGMVNGDFATFTGDGATWNDVAANTSPTGTVTANKIHIGAMHNAGSGSNLFPYFNGAVQATKTGTATSASGLWVGAPYSPGVLTQELVGAFHEVIVILGNPSSSDINRLFGAAAWKWGTVDNLPAAHPFKNRPPLIGD
jgi:hypothetical protein